MAGENSLQELPIPSLRHTIDVYLKSLIPLDLYDQKTVQDCEKFVLGVGKDLQERLMALKQSKFKDSSWLIDHWNKVAYFAYRETIVHNVSVYFLFKNELAQFMEPITRVSRLTVELLSITQLIRQKNYKFLNENSQKLCKKQFKFYFNSCRVPAEFEDFVEHGSTQNTVIVVYKDTFYEIDVTSIMNDQELQTNDKIFALYSIFKKLLVRGKKSDHFPGILTSQHRDIWFNQYHKIKSFTSLNERNLKKIRESMFMICFEDQQFESKEEFCNDLLHGRMRYWDKTLQLIVYKNGTIGVNGEHSLCDGSITAEVFDAVLRKMNEHHESLKRGIFVSDVQISELKAETLNFDLDNDLKQAIREADEHLKSFYRTKEHRYLEFTSFGKQHIKSLNCSPDGFVQIALHLTFYRLNSRFCATYEAANTRSFFQGRTAVIRSCTKEVRLFCEDPSYERLQRALKNHRQLVRKASTGFGCDRHLLGLKMCLKSDERCEFFESNHFQHSSTWIMSTSRLDGEFFDAIGFGEVAENGFGICYVMKNDSIHVVVSSDAPRKNRALMFLKELHKSFLLIEDVALRGSRPSSKI